MTRLSITLALLLLSISVLSGAAQNGGHNNRRLLATSRTNKRTTIVTNSTNTVGANSSSVVTSKQLIQLYKAKQYAKVATIIKKRRKNQGRYTDTLNTVQVLTVLYHAGSKKEFYQFTIIAANKIKKNDREGQFLLAMGYLSNNKVSRFLYHSLLFLDTKRQREARLHRKILEAFSDKNYTETIKRIKNLSPQIQQNRLLLSLLAYCYLKTSNLRGALFAAKQLYITRIKLPLLSLKLLFQLSLKNRSAIEAVYWGEKIAKQFPQMLKNYTFLNNLSMAYFHDHNTLRTKKRKRQRAQQALQYAKKALRIKPIAPILHTLSLSYEINNNIKKAIEAILLARALKPKNKAYIKRLHLLRKKQKKGRY